MPPAPANALTVADLQRTAGPADAPCALDAELAARIAELRDAAAYLQRRNDRLRAAINAAPCSDPGFQAHADAVGAQNAALRDALATRAAGLGPGVGVTGGGSAAAPMPPDELRETAARLREEQRVSKSLRVALRRAQDECAGMQEAVATLERRVARTLNENHTLGQDVYMLTAEYTELLGKRY